MDNNHIQQALDYLESEYETWNDSFESQWVHLNDNDYNAKADQLSFDEDRPLKNFETSFGHSSLRAKIETQINAWLNNTSLDPNTDPENKTGFDDEFLRTLVNDKSEIQVGNSIYLEKPYYASPGSPPAAILISISGSNSSLLQTIRSKAYLTGADFSPLGGSGLNANGFQTNIVPGASPGFLYGKSTTVGITPYLAVSGGRSCIGWKRNADRFPYGNNKEYKVVASLRNYFFVPRIAAKTVSYEKKPNGKWGKLRTRLVASISGKVYNENCGIPTTIPPRRREKRRSRIRVNINGNYFSVILMIIKAENPYDIDTYHYCNGEEKLWGVFW
ncbi:MAG: hypothetical protein NW226_16420 [Microscillaceae bacterium]|nr:hypothetical protein [Microscillaceae bacterium]